jgi:hypothetical protein
MKTILKNRKFRVAMIFVLLLTLVGGTAVSAAPLACGPFVDIPTGAWYCANVLRILDLNITTGTSGTTYSPTVYVNRAQMAAFIDRVTKANSDSQVYLFDLDHNGNVTPDGAAIRAISEDGSSLSGISDGVGLADNGVYGQTNSTSSSDAGVRGTNIGTGPGVYGYSTAAGTANFGVRGYSGSSHGVYGVAGTTDGDYGGGYFYGPTGLYATADDASGDAVRANCPGTGLAGCWGLDADSGNSTGVVADTARTDQNYGILTNDNLYVGGSCIGCTVAMIVQNGSDKDLSAGDLVAVIGISAPLAESNEPTITVTKADLGSTNGVIGVVKNTLEIEMISKPEVTFVEVQVPDPEGGEADVVWEPQTTERMIAVHNGVERSAQPGDYLVIIVQGMAQVNVDAGQGPIAAGDQLVLFGDAAVSAANLESTDSKLTSVGTTVENLNEGRGMVWVLVDFR